MAEPEAPTTGAVAGTSAVPGPGSGAGAAPGDGAASVAGPAGPPPARRPDELRSGFALYRRLVRARIRADWQYRTSFLMLLAGQTVAAGLDLASIVVIFSAVDDLAGWSAGEVAFLYGASGLSFGLCDLLVSPVERASQHIRAGTFDVFLVRPAGTLWQLLGHEFALRRAGRMVQPLAALVVALTLVDVAWTPATVALVPLTVVCGAVIYGAIFVVTSALSFWTVESQEVANAFTYGGDFVASYPIDVLGRWMRRLATFVVPIASVAYLPATRLFHHPLPVALPRWSAWTGPLVAAAAFGVARATWGLAVRRYRSTGS